MEQPLYLLRELHTTRTGNTFDAAVGFSLRHHATYIVIRGSIFDIASL